MTARKLKVYSWTGHRIECKVKGRDWALQTHEVIAARSMAEVGRIACAAGVLRHTADPRQLFNLGETANAESVEQALGEPGVIFWRPLDQIPRERAWTKSGDPMNTNDQPLPSIWSKSATDGLWHVQTEGRSDSTFDRSCDSKPDKSAGTAMTLDKRKPIFDVMRMCDNAPKLCKRCKLVAIGPIR